MVKSVEYVKRSEASRRIGGSCSRPRLLIIERDDAAPGVIQASLETQACCTIVRSFAALRHTKLHAFDVALIGLDLRDASGLDAVRIVHADRPDLPVIVVGGPEDAGHAADAIRAGAIDFVVCDGPDARTLRVAIERSAARHVVQQERSRLQVELGRVLGELRRRNTQLESLVERLERKSRTDALTGLASRRWLDLMLHGSWAEATRCGSPLACLMIDLDDFKSINDRLGHQRGDDLLREAARVIASSCREVDVAVRYGGDEFCVLMPRTGVEDAIAVAEQILDEWSRRRGQRPADEPLVGMTIGVSEIDASRPECPLSLMRLADEALYEAKAAGKNRVGVRRAREMACA